MPDLTVTRNDADGRYEARLAEDVAVIAFRRRDTDPPVLVMSHTEVPDGMRGQGVGGRLVEGALDDVRSRGELVEPTCPFVASWIQEHPEYADLVAGDARG